MDVEIDAEWPSQRCLGDITPEIDQLGCEGVMSLRRVYLDCDHEHENEPPAL